MTQEQDPQDPVPPRKIKWRVVWHSARVLMLILAVPLVFALIAGAMMIDRDISAPSWIKNRVSERAADMLGGGSVTFGEITVNVGRDLHPRVRLTDAVLRDADGARLAAVNEISGLMSPRGLLFERAALVQEVTLSGTQIALRRNADGTVAMSFDLNAGDAQAAQSLTDLLDQVDTVFERPALVALEQVAVNGIVVNFDDARAGRSWTVDGGTLALDLRDGRTRLTGEAFVLSGGAVTEIALNYVSPQGSQAADIAVALTDIPADDLATQSAALNWLSALDAGLSAKLDTSIGPQGQLGPLNVALEIGQGALRPAGGAAPVAFDGVSTALTYDPAAQSLRFDDMAISSEWGRLKGQGQALLRDVRDGLPETLIAQFTFAELALNPMGLYDGAAPITDAAVDLRVRLAPFEIDIGQAVLSGEGYQVVADGRVAAEPEGWSIAMDMQIPQMDFAELRALWPATFRPGTYKWFSENVFEGAFRSLYAGYRAAPGQPVRFSAGYDFTDTEVRFMRTMPHIAQARGHASLIDDRFVVALSDGRIMAPEGGAVDITGSVFAIADTTVKPAQMQLDLAAVSSMTAVLSLLDQPPFEFMTKANRPVTLADGRARVAGRWSWLAKPREERRPGDVAFDVTANLSAVRSNQIVPGRALVASRATVRADNGSLSISGPMTLDGVPVTGTWSRAIGPGAAPESEVVAEVEISPRFLDAFNIALPPGSVSGRGTGDLVMRLRPGQPADFTLVSDLRGVGLAILPLGWSKPPGERGNLLVSGALATPPRIDRLEVSGGGLDAEGRITLTDQGALSAARFDRVRLGNWLNAPITLRGRGRGVPVGVTVGGGTVDLRRARFAGGEGDTGPVEITLDRLQITDGIALDAFRGSFNGEGGLSGQFQGRVNGGPAVQGTVVPRDGRSAVRLISNDAGGLASAAGLLENATGGSLDLTLLPAGGAGTFDGRLAIRGLRIRDAPAMAALLDAISVVGLLQQLDGQGLAFDEVDARFILTPRAVQIIEASAVGPGLGISLDGFYTLASKQLDLQGVISPFFIINSIGSVLTRKGEGLIGFNYTVRGSADAPQVSVNPLSALTPGGFRELFRTDPPQVSQ